MKQATSEEFDKAVDRCLTHWTTMRVPADVRDLLLVALTQVRQELFKDEA